MTNQEKVDLLNSLELTDAQGGADCYAYVSLNDATQNVLLQLGKDAAWIQKHSWNGEEIDIVPLSFECGAKRWDGEKFFLQP